MKLTRDKFAEIHRERQTHAKNRGESLRRVWWGWEDREARESNTGVITAAESRPLADLGTSVTRTASGGLPPIPTTRIPASAANVPSSAAVTVQTSEATGFQTSNQRRSHLRWGEHSSRAQEVWSAHVGCWWGEEDLVWEAIFQKKFFEERIQSLTALQNRCSWRWGR